MSSVLEQNLQIIKGLPECDLFTAFAQIVSIPRDSGKEQAILSYISAIAKAYNFPFRFDDAGNLLVMMPSLTGDGSHGITIQGHVDMVCVKNNATQHDFATQGILLQIDEHHVSAKGTSLGADNGIAIAMMIQLMRNGPLSIPIDFLFTVEEETGLHGASKLDPGFLRFKRLLNIDSEEEGSLYIGCAGGGETKAELPMVWQQNPYDSGMKLGISGLSGGHSGVNIHKQPANAIVVLVQFLQHISVDIDFSLIALRGGERHNVIPREAVAHIAYNKIQSTQLFALIESFKQTFGVQYHGDEPDMVCSVEITEANLAFSASCINKNSLHRFLCCIVAIPHGVLAMSRIMIDLVSQSSNLAIVMLEQNGSAMITTSQRAESDILLQSAMQKVAAVFYLTGASYSAKQTYPSWLPDPNHEFLKLAIDCYKTMFSTIPAIKAIHAGLETGVFAGKKAGILMLSVGPDIQGAHSPGEKLSILSTIRVWHFVQKMLQALAEVKHDS